MYMHMCRYHPHTLWQAECQAQGRRRCSCLQSALNKGRGDSSVVAAVSKECMELDMGDWHEVVDGAHHLVKLDHSADPA